MLSRMTYKGWFFVLTIMLYAVTNPSPFSLVDLWLRDGAILDPFVWIISLVFIVPLILIAWHTAREFNIFGYILFAVSIGVGLWATYTVAPNMFDFVNYWFQPIVAALFVCGLKFPKLRRSVTTVTSVDTEVE